MKTSILNFEMLQNDVVKKNWAKSIKESCALWQSEVHLGHGRMERCTQVLSKHHLKSEDSGLQEFYLIEGSPKQH